MATNTTNMNLIKPEQVIDRNQWGTQLNTNADTVDAWVSPFVFAKEISSVSDGDYLVVLEAPFDGTIESIVTRTNAGTATLTGKINGVDLGGTVNSCSVTKDVQTHASNNTFVKGAEITFTITNNINSSGLFAQFQGIRTGA